MRIRYSSSGSCIYYYKSRLYYEEMNLKFMKSRAVPAFTATTNLLTKKSLNSCTLQGRQSGTKAYLTVVLFIVLVKIFLVEYVVVAGKQSLRSLFTVAS